MRCLLLAICLTSVIPVCAGDGLYPQISKPGAYAARLERNPKYADYVYRRKARRANALELRRRYNAMRGPAVYQIGRPSWLANPFWSAIGAGMVRQSPIPTRQRVYIPVIPMPDYHDSPGYRD